MRTTTQGHPVEPQGTGIDGPQRGTLIAADTMIVPDVIGRAGTKSLPHDTGTGASGLSLQGSGTVAPSGLRCRGEGWTYVQNPHATCARVLTPPRMQLVSNAERTNMPELWLGIACQKRKRLEKQVSPQEDGSLPSQGLTGSGARQGRQEAGAEGAPPVGTIHQASVQSVRPFGVFVALPGWRRHGLIHHSQVAEDVSFSREDEDDVRIKALEFFLPRGSQVHSTPSPVACVPPLGSEWVPSSWALPQDLRPESPPPCLPSSLNLA